MIVTQLPFDVPTHPITEAKSEYIKEMEEPIRGFDLPDALIKFRQGIETNQKKDDKDISILDSRILAVLWQAFSSELA